MFAPLLRIIRSCSHQSLPCTPDPLTRLFDARGQVLQRDVRAAPRAVETPGLASRPASQLLRPQGGPPTAQYRRDCTAHFRRVVRPARYRTAERGRRFDGLPRKGSCLVSTSDRLPSSSTDSDVPLPGLLDRPLCRRPPRFPPALLSISLRLPHLQ